MTNLRNKKRITSAIVALLLVFVVGAAFAATPGVLTISGIVSIDQELLLEFVNVTVTNTPAPMPPLVPNVYGSAIRQPGADGRPNQTIIFTVDISSARMPGQTVLNFTIENTGQLDAQLAAAWLEYSVQEQLDDAFGYDWFTVTETLPSGGPPIAVGGSVIGSLTIDFEPQLDPDWIPTGDPDELPDLLQTAETGSFEITLGYFAATP